jgi:hypothetical protein
VIVTIGDRMKRFTIEHHCEDSQRTPVPRRRRQPQYHCPGFDAWVAKLKEHREVASVRQHAYVWGADLRECEALTAGGYRGELSARRSDFVRGEEDAD